MIKKSRAQIQWIEWVEPFGPNNEPVYMRVTPETAIAVIKKANPKIKHDKDALDEFVVVHWAKLIYNVV